MCNWKQLALFSIMLFYTKLSHDKLNYAKLNSVCYITLSDSRKSVRKANSNNISINWSSSDIQRWINWYLFFLNQFSQWKTCRKGLLPDRSSEFFFIVSGYQAGIKCNYWRTPGLWIPGLQVKSQGKFLSIFSSCYLVLLFKYQP